MEKNLAETHQKLWAESSPKGMGSMATIRNMTLEQLRQMIDERIDERLAVMLGRLDVGEEGLFEDGEPDVRSWEQVKQDIERDRWTPPPGAKSSLELLREDRDA